MLTKEASSLTVNLLSPEDASCLSMTKPPDVSSQTLLPNNFLRDTAIAIVGL